MTKEESKALRKKAGVWLAEQRKNAGLSQSDLAKILDIDYYTFISQIEQGHLQIPKRRYADYAAALGRDAFGFIWELLPYYEPYIAEMLKKDVPIAEK